MNVQLSYDVAASRVPGFASVAATLPMSLRPVREGENADILVIGGDAWTVDALVALGRAPRGILVVDPRPVAADEVRSLAAELNRVGIVVALAEDLAGNPAVAAVTEAAGAALSRASAVWATVSSTAPSNAGALALVRLLRALGYSDLRTEAIDVPRGFLLTGTTAEGVAVTAHAVPSSIDDGQAHVRVQGFDATVSLTLPPVSTTRPAIAAVTDASSERVLPSIYETAHRSALVRLVRAIRDNEKTASPLTAFADDLAAAAPSTVTA